MQKGAYHKLFFVFYVPGFCKPFKLSLRRTLQLPVLIEQVYNEQGNKKGQLK
jgi:hypothetical protein